MESDLPAELQQRLDEVYTRELQRCLDEARASDAALARKTIQNAAHMLRGSAFQMGDYLLHSRARALDDACLDPVNGWDVLGPLRDAFLDAVDEALRQRRTRASEIQ